MENANIFLFVIVIAVGLIIIFFGIRQYFQAKNAEKNWLNVSGVDLIESFIISNSKFARQLHDKISSTCCLSIPGGWTDFS